MMASARLFDALPDFGPRTRLLDDGEQRSSAPHRAEARQAQPDLAGTVRMEVARAEAALALSLGEQHAAVLQAEQERHQAELAAQAHSFGELAGQQIAARFAEAEGELLAHVTSTVARIVGGILTEDIQSRSIDSLSRAIKAAIADSEAVRIEVRGPQSLFAALSETLADRTGSIDYLEDDGFDLTVTIDGTLFETRLAEWSSALSEILA